MAVVEELSVELSVSTMDGKSEDDVEKVLSTSDDGEVSSLLELDGEDSNESVGPSTAGLAPLVSMAPSDGLISLVVGNMPGIALLSSSDCLIVVDNEYDVELASAMLGEDIRRFDLLSVVDEGDSPEDTKDLPEPEER